MTEHKLIRVELDEMPSQEAPRLVQESWTRRYAPFWLRLIIVLWLACGSAFLIFQGEWIFGGAMAAAAVWMAARIRVQGKLG